MGGLLLGLAGPRKERSAPRQARAAQENAVPARAGRHARV